MASHSCPASTNCNRWNRLWSTAPWYSAKNFLRSSGCRVRRPSRWLRSTFWNTSWRSVGCAGSAGAAEELLCPSNAHSACSVPSSFSSHSVVCVTSRPSLVRCASFDKKSTVSFTESDPGRFGSGNGDAGDAVDEGASEALVSPSFVSFDSPSFASPSFSSSSSASRAAFSAAAFSRAASAPGRSLPPRRPGRSLPPRVFGGDGSSSSFSSAMSASFAPASAASPAASPGPTAACAASPGSRLAAAATPAGIAAASPTAPGAAPATASSAQPLTASSVAMSAAPCVLGSLMSCRSMRRKSCLCSPPDGITREAIRDTHRDMTCAAEPYSGAGGVGGAPRAAARGGGAAPAALAWFSSCVSLDSSLTRCGR